MLCASHTKNVAPGMRIGWVYGGRFSEKIAYLKRISSVGQPKFIELALADYMATGGMAKQLRYVRRAMRTQVINLAEHVTNFFPMGTTFRTPSGGFLLWVELPWDINPAKLQNFAIHSHISVLPGALFSNEGHYKNFIRINCCALYNKCSRGSIHSLADFIKKHNLS